MGLEFSFLMGTTLSRENMKKVVRDLSKKNEDHKMEITDGQRIWGFKSNLLSCWVLDNHPGLRLFSEDYGLHLQFDFEFDLFLDEYQKGEEVMMHLIGELLRICDDCLLLANGDTPIVMRRGGRTVVDDSRWVDREHFPYEALGIDFEWGVIPYD